MTDLRDLHPDRPIRWPVRLAPHHRATLYRLIDHKLLGDWWLLVTDTMQLDGCDEVLDLYADMTLIPGIAEGETPEHDLYVTLAEIAAIARRNGPAGQLPWRAP